MPLARYKRPAVDSKFYHLLGAHQICHQPFSKEGNASMGAPSLLLLLVSGLASFHLSEGNFGGFGGYGAMPAYGGGGYGGYKPMGYGAMPYGGAMPYAAMMPYMPPPQQYPQYQAFPQPQPHYTSSYSNSPFDYRHAPYSPITILQSQTSTANLTDGGGQPFNISFVPPPQPAAPGR